MAALASLIDALAYRTVGREHFLADAQPGLGEAAAETSPICGIDVDDQAGEILLLCSPQTCSSSQLTLAKLLEALRELAPMRPTHVVELTLQEDQHAEHSETAILRFDYPVVGLSINETAETISLHWLS